jgi:hypothetical protein
MKLPDALRKPAKAIGLLVAIVGLFPFSYPLCPDWNVTVVDASGMPVQGMTVRRSCNDSITDEYGKASFDVINSSSPILLRWIGNILGFATLGGFHGSFGRHSYVFAFDQDSRSFSPVVDGYDEDWTGSPNHMESKIVVNPAR